MHRRDFLSSILLSALASSAYALDMKVEQVYLTQASQTYSKSVPLIAQRRAVVRVFVSADGPNTARPRIKLDLYYNGVFSRSAMLDPHPSMTGVPQQVDNRNYINSYQYTLDASELRPGLQLVAEVDPETVYPQSNYQNDVWPQGARNADYSLNTAKLLREDVRSHAAFRTMLVPLRTSNGLTGDVSLNNVESYVGYLRRVLPVPEQLDVRVHAPFYVNYTPGPNYDNGWTRVLNEMDALRQAENNNGRHYYAALKPGYGSGGSGMAWIGGWAAMGVDWSSQMGGSNGTVTWRNGTYAHELGHNLGLYHAPCGGAAGSDRNYPYAGGGIGQTGYDVWNQRPYNPGDSNGWTDLMGYCGYDWISDYQYKRALSWRGNNALQAQTQFMAEAGESLLVWGRVEQGRVVLEPSLRVAGPPSVPDAQGDYTLEALDQQGRVIQRHRFAMQQADHSSDQGFALRLPLAKSNQLQAESRVASLRLLRQGLMVASLDAGQRPALASLQAASLRPLGQAQAQLRWDGQRYPLAMVRDRQSGEIIAFARHGSFTAPRAVLSRIEVQFSDGVNQQLQQFDLNTGGASMY